MHQMHDQYDQDLNNEQSRNSTQSFDLIQNKDQLSHLNQSKLVELKILF
jgi:hypothetical protein